MRTLFFLSLFLLTLSSQAQDPLSAPLPEVLEGIKEELLVSHFPATAHVVKVVKKGGTNYY